MAAVTFDKELLQSCVKAEIEVEHYKDLTKSSNRAGLLPFPLIAAAWPPSHTYTTTTEDPTLTPGERQVSNTYTMTHHHQRQAGEPKTYTKCAKWDIFAIPIFAYYFRV